MSVTVDEILNAARLGAAALTGETAGYLLLGAADRLPEASGRLASSAVLLAEDGSLAVLPLGPGSDVDLEADLRGLLGRMLAHCRQGVPALARVARPLAPAEARGLQRLVGEIEAALIPVNRSAARRALSRLHRDVVRAKASGRLVVDAVAPSTGTEVSAAVVEPEPRPTLIAQRDGIAQRSDAPAMARVALDVPAVAPMQEAVAPVGVVARVAVAAPMAVAPVGVAAPAAVVAPIARASVAVVASAALAGPRAFAPTVGSVVQSPAATHAGVAPVAVGAPAVATSDKAGAEAPLAETAVPPAVALRMSAAAKNSSAPFAPFAPSTELPGSELARALKLLAEADLEPVPRHGPPRVEPIASVPDRPTSAPEPTPSSPTSAAFEEAPFVEAPPPSRVFGSRPPPLHVVAPPPPVAEPELTPVVDGTTLALERADDADAIVAVLEPLPGALDTSVYEPEATPFLGSWPGLAPVVTAARSFEWPSAGDHDTERLPPVAFDDADASEERDRAEDPNAVASEVEVEVEVEVELCEEDVIASEPEDSAVAFAPVAVPGSSAHAVEEACAETSLQGATAASELDKALTESPIEEAAAASEPDEALPEMSIADAAAASELDEAPPEMSIEGAAAASEPDESPVEMSIEAAATASELDEAPAEMSLEQPTASEPEEAPAEMSSGAEAPDSEPEEAPAVVAEAEPSEEYGPAGVDAPWSAEPAAVAARVDADPREGVAPMGLLFDASCADGEDVVSPPQATDVFSEGVAELLAEPSDSEGAVEESDVPDLVPEALPMPELLTEGAPLPELVAEVAPVPEPVAEEPVIPVPPKRFSYQPRRSDVSDLLAGFAVAESRSLRDVSRELKRMADVAGTPCPPSVAVASSKKTAAR
jgi:hypothetical protein